MEKRIWKMKVGKKWVAALSWVPAGVTLTEFEDEAAQFPVSKEPAPIGDGRYYPGMDTYYVRMALGLKGKVFIKPDDGPGMWAY